MNPDPTSLDRLHDIVTPPPVPWWPPAVGWYCVVVLVLVLALVLLVRGFIRWQHNRYRREALAELARQECRLCDPAKRPAALMTMAELLKRAAITAFSRGEVAALTSAAWFAFLDRTGHTAAFSRGEGAKLEAAVYNPARAADLNESEVLILAQHVRHWLKHHTAEFEQKDAKSAKGESNRPASLPSRSSVHNGMG